MRPSQNIHTHSTSISLIKAISLIQFIFYIIPKKSITPFNLIILTKLINPIRQLTPFFRKINIFQILILIVNTP